MNKMEWIINNPCDDCDNGFKEVREPYYDFGNECRCNDQSKYYLGVYAQRKLLGYQKECLVKLHSYSGMKLERQDIKGTITEYKSKWSGYQLAIQDSINFIESMIKELEEKQNG